MLDALGTDSVKMARVKGMPQRGVLWKHGLKNAAIPVFTCSRPRHVNVVHVGICGHPVWLVLSMQIPKGKEG
jgi:hypothetical protein